MSYRVNGDLKVDNNATIGGAAVIVGSCTVLGFAVPGAQIAAYSNNSSDQTGITTEADITGLTALAWPGTGANGSKIYQIDWSIQGINTGGAASSVTLKLYVGTNGNKSDGAGDLTYTFVSSFGASQVWSNGGSLILIPAAGTKFGFSATFGSASTIYGGTTASKYSNVIVAAID